MTERETNLLRAARAMFSAILSAGVSSDIIECLGMPAKDVDAAIEAYNPEGTS